MNAGILPPEDTDGSTSVGAMRPPFPSGLDRAAARPWAEAHSWDATLDGLRQVFESVAGRAAP